MSKKVLIVGGVAGGASAAARLRRLDENAEIILFERGDYVSYANCGLPYYIGDVIKERDALLVETPEKIKGKFNIDVRIRNEVIKIDKENKKIQVKNHNTGEIYTESYDTLVLSTGSSPLRPPIKGIDSPNIYTLWTIPDTDAIKDFITEKNAKRVAVIGGGFIGLEMAENLHHLGLQVSIIEMLDQVMAPVDYDMAQILHDNIRTNHVNLILGDGVDFFEDRNSKTIISLKSGKKIEADLVILSIGVRPNSELAKDAGLETNPRGGIIVDDYLKTSDKNIYAIGDVIEVEEFMNKGKTMIPLAGPANKQGRICANNIMGEKEKYKGTQGTSVAQVFDMTVGVTGLNEKTLKNLGKEYEKDYYIATISQKSHAGYYPGAVPIILKLLFDGKGKIFGAQIVGQDGVDKRIDTIATTIRMGGTIYDLKELELAYAPPYSSAKDPVNMLGFVAENILTKKVAFMRHDELKTLNPDTLLIVDVSEYEERLVANIENSVHIPLGQLRGRLNELDKTKLIIPYCAIGVRSYIASRILTQNGFQNVKVYEGGLHFYKALTHDKNINENPTNPYHPSSNNKEDSLMEQDDMEGEIKATITVDCSGLQCPGPIMKVFKTIHEINDGEIIKISATDIGFAKDIESWCNRTKNTLVKIEKNNKEVLAYIQKGTSFPTLGPTSGSAAPVNNGKTLIVFSGDLDKVLAAFIIATGGASMGRKVTMFFTFWGLNALRKAEKVKVKKPFMDAMFGAMMPKGAGKLKLSKMNMGGMGTAMMRKVMKDKNVDSLEDLIKQAIDSGIRIVACTMSMDVMGITKDELIDGVEYAGVANYLGDAEESNVNLFV